MAEVDGVGCPVRFLCEFAGGESRVLVEVLVYEGADVVLLPALSAADRASAMHAADLLNLLLAARPVGEEQIAAGWKSLANKFPGIDRDEFLDAVRYLVAGTWPVDALQYPPTRGRIGRVSPHPGSTGTEPSFIRLRHSGVLQVFDEARLVDAAYAAGWKPLPGDEELLAERAAGWIARNLYRHTFPGAAMRTSQFSSEPGSSADIGPGFSMSWGGAD